MNTPVAATQTASEAVTADVYRRKLAAALANVAPLRPIKFMAFGDGGHDANNKAKPLNGSEKGLAHEVQRVPVASLTQDDLYSATGMAVLYPETYGAGVVSEAALFDADGDIVCIKNFRPKYLENAETYGIKLKMRT